MEPNFQTSFIPKKPMVDDRTIPSRPISLFSLLSIFLLLTMFLVTGGLYFYKGVLTKSISQMESDLNLAKNRFEPAKITQLQVLDQRLKASSEILSSHIAISPIFSALEDITMKSVRFNKFTYTFDTTTAETKVVVKMTGQAIGYRSIALQSDLFTKNKYFIDPVFSNLALDDKGNVLFDLTFNVDPTFIDYKQVLKVAAEKEEASNTNTTIQDQINTNPQPETVTPTTPTTNTPPTGGNTIIPNGAGTTN
ncbi:hypothetical protein K2P96_02040 [Patescibacteria group bacterium]|nr:hypothetical protein [Patescibacteria group bacterium]